MSKTDKKQIKKINSIRTFLLLEEDKEIKNSMNLSQMRINGLTSKEFMEKNKMDYIISINNGIIYDCYKLPKNEEIQCDSIFGKFCNKINLDFHKMKKNKIDLGLRKNNNFIGEKENNNNMNDEENNKKNEEEIVLNRKKNHLNSVKDNINFLKRISFCLKSPLKEKVMKSRKSVGGIPTKMMKEFKKNLNSNDYETEFIPKKKKATRNLKKYTSNLKFDKELLNNYYNNNYLINEYHRGFAKKQIFF